MSDQNADIAVAGVNATVPDLYYENMIMKIVEAQEAVIGPVAIEQARGVSNLAVNWVEKRVTINGDPSHVVDELVEKYKQLFGRISVEVCKDAVTQLSAEHSEGLIPRSLR